MGPLPWTRFNGSRFPSFELPQFEAGLALPIDIHLDSAYFFDCGAPTLDLVFHPGGMVHAIGQGGEVAFYAEGGHKVFVKSQGSETREIERTGGSAEPVALTFQRH
jgi:hypothetical protein